jgi:hypothetical protein
MPQETELTICVRSVVCVESKRSGENVGGELGKGTVRDKREEIPSRQSQRRALLVVQQGCAHFSSRRRAVKARIAFCADAQRA